MKRRTELRLLMVAVAVMVLGLIGTLGVLRRASTVLAGAHENISQNAAPTVVALDVAQARLRKLHILVVDRLMGTPGDPAIRDSSIAAAQRDLERGVNDYLKLPFDPGEVPLQHAVTESLEQMERVVNRAMTLEPRTDEGLRRELDQAVALLSLDLAQASEFAAHLATVWADKVERTSTRLLPTGASIEGITFVAAVGTLALTYRAVKRARAIEAQALLAQERRADELENFSGRVAHDLLSPLMTIAMALEMAKRRLTGPNDAPTQKALTRASHTLERIRRVVSDLLEFARTGAKPAPGARAYIDEAVRDIEEEFGPAAEDAGIDLHVEAVTACAVACSPGVLTSVLSNLVQNAIKYMGNGDERRISIRVVKRRDAVRVEVQDTGPGIRPSDCEHLFEPYTRGRDAKKPGLGLGLATVKRLVESHGGQVGLETTLGRGSVFWFSMPIAKSSIGA